MVPISYYYYANDTKDKYDKINNNNNNNICLG